MDFIAVVFSLLIILVPVVAKVIEKKLVQSGRQGSAEKVRKVRELFSDEDGKSAPAMPQTVEAGTSAGAPVAVDGGQPAPRPAGAFQSADFIRPSHQAFPDRASEPVRESAAGTGNGIYSVPEEGTRKKLEIDPRKLIIYSEIMRPKFRDNF